MSFILDCFVSGYNFEFGDIDVISTARDANNCQIECSRNALCNYWTFELTEKKCHLKRELIKATKEPKCQSGPKRCLTKSHAEKEMQERSCLENVGVDMYGGDLPNGFSSASTPESCQHTCQLTPECIFFSHIGTVSYFSLLLSNIHTQSLFKGCYLKKHGWSKRTGKGFVSGYGWCPVSHG